MSVSRGRSDLPPRALEVLTIGPLATVQDLGRTAHVGVGVPRSGAMDLEAMRAAIDAVSGAPTDAVIELPLLGARFLAHGRVLASIDGEPARALEDGAVLELPRAERAVRYLAVEGGIDVPCVLGSRSTLLTAALGGFHGRALRIGDRVHILSRDTALPPRQAAVRALTIESTLEAIATLDADPHALAQLVSRAWRVDPRSDRVGTRLDGAAIERVAASSGVSRPMVPGAIQLPPDGKPIVLGADAPTTGGYAAVAVLTRIARAHLARLRPGCDVSIALAG